MWFWFCTSLAAWIALSVVGSYWYPLHASSASTILFAMAIGCTANWMRNRSLHCAITGPLFYIAAALFLLSDLAVIHANIVVIWVVVSVGICIAFLLEWRYATRSRGLRDAT